MRRCRSTRYIHRGWGFGSSCTVASRGGREGRLRTLRRRRSRWQRRRAGRGVSVFGFMNTVVRWGDGDDRSCRGATIGTPSCRLRRTLLLPEVVSEARPRAVGRELCVGDLRAIQAGGGRHRSRDRNARCGSLWQSPLESRCQWGAYARPTQSESASQSQLNCVLCQEDAIEERMLTT